MMKQHHHTRKKLRPNTSTPVSAAEIHAEKKERKARTILLIGNSKEHLRRFRRMDDAKEIWEAIRTSSEGLEKGYDRFQQLLSQLEAYGAEVSTEDANYKFLRSLPPAWSKSDYDNDNQTDVDTVVQWIYYQDNTNKVKSVYTVAIHVLISPTTIFNHNIQEREVPAVLCCWKNMEDRGIFDNGCSRHMTGNTGSPDILKNAKERESLLLEILLKVPRQNNMYSFDMKTPGLTKDYACLIAKATSDESKLWHKRLGRYGENRASWSDRLDDALWAFRTAYKTPIGCTPYKLVYGKSCHLPIELEHRAYWALKHQI
ncbi:reverse transcriptase domain-containing protein [Tanacetum coccineum]